MFVKHIVHTPNFFLRVLCQKLLKEDNVRSSVNLSNTLGIL